MPLVLCLALLANSVMVRHVLAVDLINPNFASQTVVSRMLMDVDVSLLVSSTPKNGAPLAYLYLPVIYSLAPTTQFQCDSGASPATGFSVGCDGTVAYNGSTTFYECQTGENVSDACFVMFPKPALTQLTTR